MGRLPGLPAVAWKPGRASGELSFAAEWPQHKGRNRWGRGGRRAGGLGQRGQETKGQEKGACFLLGGRNSPSSLRFHSHIPGKKPATTPRAFRGGFGCHLGHLGGTLALPVAPAALSRSPPQPLIGHPSPAPLHHPEERQRITYLEKRKAHKCQPVPARVPAAQERGPLSAPRAPSLTLLFFP